MDVTSRTGGGGAVLSILYTAGVGVPGRHLQPASPGKAWHATANSSGTTLAIPEVMPTKLFALLGLVAACSACDETAGAVHRDYLDRHEESFVFHVDRAQIVAGLEGLFADEGVTLVEPTSGDTLATTKSASKWTYVVHLIPCSGGHLVHVVGQLRDDSDAIVATEQETDKMWELAQRLEPDRALEITDAANQRADKVAPRARTAH